MSNNKKIDFGKFQIEEIKPNELKDVVGAWCGIGNYGSGGCVIANHPDQNPRTEDPWCLISNQKP